MAEIVLRYALYTGKVLFYLMSSGIMNYQWKEPFDQVNESVWLL